MSNPETPTSSPVPNDPGILDYAAAMGKGFVQGAAEGYVNNLKMAADAVKAVPRAVGALKDDLITNNVAAVANAAFGPGTLSTVSAEDREASMPSAMQYSTAAGPATEGILEFAAGYSLLGGALAPSRGATAIRSLTTMAGQGAATSFALANQETENVSNLLVRLGGPANNYFTRALSTNADDSILKRKVKAALEGVVFDGALSTIESIVKLTRSLRNAKTPEETLELLAKIQAQKDKLAAEAQSLEAPKASTMPQDASVPSGASESASNAGTAVMPSNGVVEAYHGTPHTFQPESLVEINGQQQYVPMGQEPPGAKVLAKFPAGRFDTGKIGTGEGAASFGHGLYFSSEKQVAQNYLDKLSETLKFVDSSGKEITYADKPDFLGGVQKTPETMAQYVIANKLSDKHLLQKYEGDSAGFLRDLAAQQRDQAEKMSAKFGTTWGNKQLHLDTAARLEEMAAKGGELRKDGKLYTVNLKPAPDEYLLWDKPLSEQSPKVRSALESLGADLSHTLGQKDGKFLQKVEPRGQEIYSRIAKQLGQDSAASEKLRELGVRGIKFLDGNSRDAGTGSYNFVIFDGADAPIAKAEELGASGLVQALVAEGAIPSDAIALATLEHTNLRTLGGTPSIDELHKAIDSTTNQAASVVSGIYRSNDQTWKDVVELIDDPSQLKFLQDNWANVGEKLPALVARANAKVVANGLLATRMAGKGDMKMSAEFLNGMIDATVERKALNRIIGQALQINDVEHLTKESEALDEVFRRLGVERDRIVSSKSSPADPTAAADPAAEKAAKAAQDAGTTFHPVLQRAMDTVEAAEAAKAKLLSEIKGTPTTAQATQLRHLEEILTESKAHLDVVKAHPEVLDAQAKYAEAIYRAGLGPSEAAKAVEGFWDIAKKIGKGVLEVWQNGLLSGLKTIVHNPISTGANVFVLRPVKQILGAVAEGDPESLRISVNNAVNLLTTAYESLGLKSRAVQNATQAFLKEKPIISQHSIENHKPVIPGIPGKIARGPGLILNASDEWFKNVSYQAWVKTQAQSDARLLGISGDKAAEFEKYYLKVAYDINGSAMKTADGKTAIFQGGIDEAAAATWTSDLLNGSLARGMEQLREKAPALRVFVTFLRTPSNILTDGANMTLGFNYLRPSKAGQQFRARLSSPDPLIRSQAKGELVMSTMLALPAVSLWASGSLTGSGPAEAQTRKALMNTGWRPYSFIFDGKVYPLNRYSPISRPLMAIADMMETLDVATDENERGSIAEKLILTFQGQLSNDTFLTGLSNLFSLLDGTPGQVEKALNSYAGSIVPGIVRDVAVAFDGQKRENDGMLGAVRNRVPGWSEFSDPARDIFGRVTTGMRGMAPWNYAFGDNRVADVISPFQRGTIDQSPVMKELVATGTVLTPPEQMYGPGINLRNYRDKTGQTYLDYWRETLGRVQLTLPDGSKALVDEALEKLINTPEYKKTALPYKGGDSYNYRVQAIKTVYEKYKLAALAITDEHFKSTTGQSIVPDIAKLKAAASGLNIDTLFEQGLTSSEEVNKLLKASGR